MSARRPPREVVRWTRRKRAGNPGTTLVAIHESVGITNAWDLALFCERRGVSYHDLADLTQMIHTVPFSDTAWHLRNGNPRAVGLCLATPVAGYSRAAWLGSQVAKVEFAAWWAARSCAILNIPIRHLNHAQIRSALRGNKRDAGVITHNDYTLATKDGTHTDPRGFPIDVCIGWALGIAGDTQPQPQSQPAEEKDLMYIPFRVQGEGWYNVPIPVGRSSRIIKAAWISVVVDGPDPGRFKFWFQDDNSGISAPEITVGFRDGRSDRRYVQVPDGATQVRIQHTLKAGAGLCFEVAGY